MRLTCDVLTVSNYVIFFF